MSGCCPPRCSASTSRRSAPAPRWRSRRCWRSSPPRDVPAALGAALNVAAAAAGKNIAVLMAYADRLERFTRWYMQLWAESLGKDGKGTTPIGALGPVDQHSQLAAFHRRPARQAVHRGHGRRRPGRARASTPSSPSARASRISPAGPSAISSPRKAAPPPRRWRRTAARCAPSTSRRSTRRASASC